MLDRMWLSTLPTLYGAAASGAWDEPYRSTRSWSGGLEIFAEGSLWSEPEEARRRLAACLERWEGPRSVHAPFWELNLASPFPDRARWSVEVLRQVVQVAAAGGAEFVVVHTHDTAAPLFDRAAARERVLSALRILAEEAAGRGVRLAVENIGVGAFSLFDRDEFVALFAEVPGAVALLDVGHAHLNGWPLAETIAALGPRLYALHVHDNHGRADEHLPVGEGTIDWQPVWQALRQLPRPPVLILEYAPGTPVSRQVDDALRIGAWLSGPDRGGGGAAAGRDGPEGLAVSARDGAHWPVVPAGDGAEGPAGGAGGGAEGAAASTRGAAWEPCGRQGT